MQAKGYKYTLEKELQYVVWFVLCVTSLREDEDISRDNEGLFVKIHHLHRQPCVLSQLVV